MDGQTGTGDSNSTRGSLPLSRPRKSFYQLEMELIRHDDNTPPFHELERIKENYK